MKSALPALCLMTISHLSFAEPDTHQHEIEEVLVNDIHTPSTVLSAEITSPSRADLSSQIKTLPGGDINQNGPLTSLIQYRGNSGNRVSLSIDGSAVVTAGPNAMDSPLSYLPSSFGKSITLSDTIAPVSVAQESLGGHISITSNKGEFGQGNKWQSRGNLLSGVSSNGNSITSGIGAFASNNTHKLGIRASYDRGGEQEYQDGKLPSSQFNRQRIDAIYGFQNDINHFVIMIGQSETKDTGTAALPMDITLIESDLLQTQFKRDFETTTVTVSTSYTDTFHIMDNFSQRPNDNSMMHRQTDANGDKTTLKITIETPLFGGQFQTGVDHTKTQHDADISNPNNPAFSIQNFNEVTKSITGVFSEWQNETATNDIEIGLRVNRISHQAGNIGTSGLMNMMAVQASALSASFNGTEKRKTDTNLDVVLKNNYYLSKNTHLSTGLARKQRSPSYQERYLWLPMQATGGLADGRTYTGNLDLKSETSNELNLGFHYANDRFYLALETYLKKIKNYIQGTASTNMEANMFATMMTGMEPLQFNNVEAKIQGAEFLYGTTFNENWQINGVLSHSQGAREDIDDNLYRISPLNNRLSLRYQRNHYSFTLESVLYAKQYKVSISNNEVATSGYGIANIAFNWECSTNVKAHLAINNIADKKYQNHLTGINRVNGSESIAVGERLYGTGRMLTLGVNFKW